MRRVWEPWFGGGIVLLVVLLIVSYFLADRLKPEPRGDMDGGRGDMTADIVVNIGEVHGGGSEATARALQEIAGAAKELASALAPPLKVEIDGAEGCTPETCAPPIFVAGDLHWSTGERTEWTAQGEACEMEWAGRVCGFGERQADETEAADQLATSMARVKERMGDWAAAGRLKGLVLLGRADRTGFAGPEYGGNRGLAQARARWVMEQLGSIDGIEDVLSRRTILTSSGPLNVPVHCPEHNADCDSQARSRDRSVDLFACLRPLATAESGTGGVVVTNDGCGGASGDMPDAAAPREAGGFRNAEGVRRVGEQGLVEGALHQPAESSSAAGGPPT